MMCMSDYEVQSFNDSWQTLMLAFFLFSSKKSPPQNPKNLWHVRNKFLSDQDLNFKFCVVIVYNYIQVV